MTAPTFSQCFFFRSLQNSTIYAVIICNLADMDIFAAIYLCRLLFLGKVAKINRYTVLIIDISVYKCALLVNDCPI